MHTSITRRTQQLGVTLIEILLVIAIIAGAGVGIFTFAKRTKVQAAVQSEQRQFDGLVETVRAIYATQPDYGTVSVANLKTAGLGPQIKYTTDAGNAVIVSKLANGQTSITVNPIQVKVPNDGFEVRYSNVSPAECTNLVAGLQAKAYEVRVGSPFAVVAHGGRMADEDTISNACAAAPTQSVAFLFWDARNIGAASTSTLPPSVCRPTTERQATPCPVGQFGTIVQERTGTCTGANNALVYTVWKTIDNTCAPMPPGVVPGSVGVPANQCGTITQTRPALTQCPVGQTGQIWEQRTQTVCTGAYTPWTTISNTCKPTPPVFPACVPGTKYQSQPCPAGQGGQITQQSSSTCPNPNGAAVWGAWQTMGNTCTASCLAAGNCCQPLKQTQTTTTACPAGSYGNPTANQERFSTCTSATTAGPWGAWNTTSTGGTACTACPANTTSTATRWVGASGGCPAGQTGSVTWEKEQTQTSTVSYNCPAGTTALPGATTSPPGPWTDTGNTRNNVNTCVAASTCANATTDPISNIQVQVTSSLGSSPWMAGNVGTSAGSNKVGGSASSLNSSVTSGTVTTTIKFDYQGTTYSCGASAAMPTSGGAQTQGSSAGLPAGVDCGGAVNGEFTWYNSSGANFSYTLGYKTCGAATCVPPPSTTATQTIACPAGQTGTITQTQTTSYSCPSSSGAPVASTGPWTTTSNTCVSSIPTSSCQCPGMFSDGTWSAYWTAVGNVSFTSFKACKAAQTADPTLNAYTCTAEVMNTPNQEDGCYALEPANFNKLPGATFCSTGSDTCPAGTIPGTIPGMCTLASSMACGQTCAMATGGGALGYWDPTAGAGTGACLVSMPMCN